MLYEPEDKEAYERNSTHAIARAVAAERERCAKIAEAEKEICEAEGNDGDDTSQLIMAGQIGAASRIAAAIRANGKFLTED